LDLIEQSNTYSLLESDDSVLIVIDVQDIFLDKLPQADSGELVNKICWLFRLAQWLQIPKIVTAEQYQKQPLAPELVKLLSDSMPVFDKSAFGLADQADILKAVEQTERKTAVLVGLETDVCVMHSALGLLDRGYRVAVVADAVRTPAPGQEIGFGRMRSAGVIVVNMKNLFYEWLRAIDAVIRFHDENPDMKEAAQTVL